MAVISQGSSDVNTFVYLYKSASISLKNSKLSVEGQFYNLLNSSVMLSFTVEAYVNHLGVIKGYPEWGEESCRLSLWKKYKLIRAAVGLEVRALEEAYPSVEKVIAFRNTMAHGRTKTYEIHEISDDILWPSLTKILTGWQKFLVVENVEEVFDSVTKLIKELHLAAGLGERPFHKYESSRMQIKFS